MKLLSDLGSLSHLSHVLSIDSNSIIPHTCTMDVIYIDMGIFKSCGNIQGTKQLEVGHTRSYVAFTTLQMLQAFMSVDYWEPSWVLIGCLGKLWTPMNLKKLMAFQRFCKCRLFFEALDGPFSEFCFVEGLELFLCLS